MSRVDVAVGIVRDKAGRILITKRKDDAHQGGLWEFPGGKLEQAEDDRQALNRELYEELNIRPKSSSPLININFNYPECHVHLHVREVHSFDGEPIGREGQACKWVAAEALNGYSFPEANKGILSALQIGRHYAITCGNTQQQILHELDYLVAQGVSMVQIRAKSLSVAETEVLITAVRLKCNYLNLRYLLNSQMPIKSNLGEGIHLSSSCLMQLKQRPESKGLVAASCHNLPELRKAESLALDFVVLSPVMATASHPGVATLGWQQFAEWVAKINIPVFALGGVTKSDYDRALACGAQGISGISLYKDTMV